MRKTRPGRVPPISRERRCSRNRSSALGRRLPLPSGQPLHPGTATIYPGLTLTRCHQRFTHVHPSGLPLTCGPRMDQGPLRLSPELRTPPLPAAHVRGGDRATNTYPGYVIDTPPPTSTQRATYTCDLVSHALEVPFSCWSDCCVENTNHPSSKGTFLISTPSTPRSSSVDRGLGRSGCRWPTGSPRPRCQTGDHHRHRAEDLLAAAAGLLAQSGHDGGQHTPALAEPTGDDGTAF